MENIYNIPENREKTYKKKLWNLLWDYKRSAILEMEKHEFATERYKRYLYCIEGITRCINFIIVIISSLSLGASSKYTNIISVVIAILSVLSLIIQSVQNIVDIKNKYSNHKISQNNYKFLDRQIQKFVVMNRSTSEFKLMTMIISDMMMVFEATSEHIPYDINKKFTDINIPPPEMPDSPENSVNKVYNINNDIKQSNAYNNQIYNLLDDKKISLLTMNQSNVINHSKWIDNYYILKNHILTRDKYNSNNIGHFKNDTEGTVVQICNNLPNIIGITPYHILNISEYDWTHNLFVEDGNRIYSKWLNSVKLQSIFLEKYRFVHSNNIFYVIAEVYPIFTHFGSFIGMEGIILGVDFESWNKFDSESILKQLKKNKDNTYDYKNVVELHLTNKHLNIYESRSPTPSSKDMEVNSNTTNSENDNNEINEDIEMQIISNKKTSRDRSPEYRDNNIV